MSSSGFDFNGIFNAWHKVDFVNEFVILGPNLHFYEESKSVGIKMAVPY